MGLQCGEPASQEHLTALSSTFIAHSVPVLIIKFPGKKWPYFMENNYETLVKKLMFSASIVSK